MSGCVTGATRAVSPVAQSWLGGPALPPGWATESADRVASRHSDKLSQALPCRAMVEFVSAVLACVDLAIKAGNAAAQHVLTVRSNKNMLAELLRHFHDLRASMSHMKDDPKLNTPVWRDALERLKTYFTKASAELDKIGGSGLRNGARRLLAPAAIAGVLHGLVRDLQHVESLLLNLDGFANLRRLNKDLLVVVRANKGVLEDVREEVTGVASSLHDVDGNVLDGFRRQDRLLEMVLAKMDAQATSAISLEDLVEAAKDIVWSRSAEGTPAGAPACASGSGDVAGPARRSDGLDLQPASDAPALDYDAINVRFAQVDPKLDRFLTAVQKGSTPPDEKDKIIQLMRKLFEPWKVDPARVSYRLDREVGSGGFGRVYKGMLDQQVVAVKVVHDAFVTADVELKADFLREASLMSELRHPCIVDFLGAYWPDAEALAHAHGSSSESDDSDERSSGGGNHGRDKADPSRAFIVMELLTCNLFVASSQYSLSANDVLQALRDIAEALRFMHSKGVVHMDVKAENVLVKVDRRNGRLEGRVKLADFGISRKKRDTVSRRRNRETALAAGTRVFMSPELLRAECGAEKACDVWSFGTLMCSLLSNARCPVLDKCDGLWLERAAADRTLQTEMATWANAIGNDRLRRMAIRCLADDPQNRPSMTSVCIVLDMGDETLAWILKQAASFWDGTGGVAKDEAKAVELYRRAADAGDTTAMNNLGLCYEYGTGVAKDKAKAVEFYRRAADAGNASAMNNLGDCYAHGRGIAEDMAKAVEFYRRAADAGDMTGRRNLALRCEHVVENLAKAVELHRHVADAGDAWDLFSLGPWNTGVAEDKAEAVELWRRANAVDVNRL
jgi:serine/threonine protein kinase